MTADPIALQACRVDARNHATRSRRRAGRAQPAPAPFATRQPGPRPKLLPGLLLGLASGLSAGAAHADDATPSTRAASLKLGYESVRLPGDERMGLVGARYLVEAAPQLHVGAAVYGAIRGDRGGLFVPGAEIMWRQPLGSRLALDAGLFVGGGGGATAPVGGGLMLRPHAELLWDFGGWRAGLSYSRVRFPSGRIDSGQWGLVWSMDSDFTSIAPGPTQAAGRSARSGVGFDRVQGVLTFYRPPSGTLLRSGATMERRVGLVGARFDHFLGAPGPSGGGAYWGIEANGAAGGGVGGYAELLAQLGIEQPVWGDRFAVGARAAFGMAGGGDVSTAGGAIGKLGLYGTLRLSPSLTLQAEGGWARAFSGDFRAPYAALALGVDLDHRGRPWPLESVTTTEWVGGVEQYRAARRDGSSRTLRNVVLKVNRYLDGDQFYLSGQARSAFDGEAGGYTVGLVGAGWRSPSWHGLRAGAELLVGAGGGGGVDSAGGALLQPTAYLAYDFAPAWSLHLGAGKIRSSSGRLSSTTAEVGLAYRFGVQGTPAAGR